MPSPCRRSRLGFALLIPVTILVALLAVSPGSAQDPNICDAPGDYPDVIVGDVTNVQRYGTLNGITSYSIGTTSCNIGTCWLNWISGASANHPVIGQNMFRLKSGRFEQIGQSWLKHGFAALNGTLCSSSCVPTDGTHLGVNCSDPYGSGLNGSQSNLGPKNAVNPTTGVHLHPYPSQGTTGDVIYKRLQVHDPDLDPALNPGSQYFVEAQYVAADDHAAQRSVNNASYRPVSITSPGGVFNVGTIGPTVREKPAIYAWQLTDPTVLLRNATVDSNELFIVGSKATALGGGLWSYEYAIHNLTSNRGARAFTLPIPAGATVANIGFHDVDYHSGEPFDGTDWTATVNSNSITWATQTSAQNPNANALRWGTLYNFRFDTDVAPVSTASGTLELFVPGSPSTTDVRLIGPDLSGAPTGAGSGGVPDGNSTPGSPFLVDKDVNGNLVLSWDDSCVLNDADYAIYAGTIGSFTSHVPIACSTGGAASQTIAVPPGDVYFLIVPSSGAREGNYGVDSEGNPRPASAAACRPQFIQGCD